MTHFPNRDFVTPLGQFEITSDVVWVTDPCYERGTWCQARFEKEFRKGTWLAFMSYFRDDLQGDGEPRKRYNVHDLIAVHSSVLWELSHFRYLSKNQTDAEFKEAVVRAKGKGVEYRESALGIDSGQVGIFDDAFYSPPSPDALPGDSENAWYEMVCDITSSRKMGVYENMGLEFMLGIPALKIEGGVVQGGCVKHTAYGDTGVGLWLTRNSENQIVKVVLDSAFSDHTEDDE